MCKAIVTKGQKARELLCHLALQSSLSPLQPGDWASARTKSKGLGLKVSSGA